VYNVSTVPGLASGRGPDPGKGANVPPNGAADEAQARLRAEAANRLNAAFGGIVSVMMNAPAFQSTPLSALRTVVVPAISTGQFSLAQMRVRESGEVRPIGALLWASVSDAVDSRLMAEASAAVRLAPHEWLSGDHLWIVEGIGERGVVANLIRRQRDKDWRGRPVKIKVRGPDGTPLVRLLPASPTT
jgi:hemolysin-activating ACP:hemolysin acyltransferase